MNFEAMSYEEMAAARTYSVVRHHRGDDGEWSKVEASGLGLEEARSKERDLTKAYAAEHPEKTSSWTMDLFILDLEQGEAMNKELTRRRMERSKQVQAEDTARKAAQP